MKKMLMGALALGFGLAMLPAQAQDAIDTSQIFVKKAIAAKMTPEQLQAYKQLLARRKAAGAFDRARGSKAAGAVRTPGDTCAAATHELGPLPYPPAPLPDTTVGATDDFDLPPDTTTPTCTAPTACTGTGAAGSLPRGAIYTGTGTGPDRAFRIRTNANCTIAVAMDPTGAEDLALILYQATCSNSLADCACASDAGGDGEAENITAIAAVGGTDYFILVDGYSTGGTPPGPSGPYTVQVTGAGCALVPVELQGFSVE